MTGLKYILPPFLQKGDKVGIIAPARKMNEPELEPAIGTIQSWGFHVELGKNLYASDRQFAGTDRQRAADLQNMMDNPDIKAIFCARGGYGSIRLLPYLDFSTFKKNPCWIVGYSDITVLHSYLSQKLSICSLHATMPLNFSANERNITSQNRLKQVLMGDLPDISFASNPNNRKGLSEGALTGGNLSMLYSMRGTEIDIDTDGKILFIEDLDEYLYHIDRMMMNLKIGNQLKNLKGLIIGGMSDMNDNKVPFGKTAKEIIAEAVAEYDYPVAFDFPAGHQKLNMPLVFGKQVKLTVDDNGSNLTYL
ncbi:MAG: LD-carboxypeptidase [Bacteroidales bacterium]|nr:LD-carboxypeptidase [Bacteroidales bacterium]MCF8455089.1 LD-carboxypeptidase [Bacteroidales bacterium]